jgi:RimJ/RimL family protein N-acetyltransferase
MIKEIKIEKSDCAGSLWVTDDGAQARKWKEEGKAVLIYLHEGNQEEDFSDFLYAAEEIETLEESYFEQVYRRLAGLPWTILETKRCIVRETTVEDVEAFYRIYEDPRVSDYLDDIQHAPEQEKEYVREYIEKIYGYYGFGVWTILEKESGVVIGRAGFSYSEGFTEPDLGFLIAGPWQEKGYAEEVCSAILAYGREELGFERVLALVRPDNLRSLRLCRKLGFVEVGEAIYRGETYIKMQNDTKMQSNTKM